MKREDFKVLVVEDEDLIRNVFEQALQSWGYTVQTADNGQQALDMCGAQKFHAIVTDLNMPVMDGMTLLKKVKSRWPFIEVVVVTGFATIEAALDAMKEGAHDFILKPVNFDQVRIAINRCYQKLKSQSETAELREQNAQLQALHEMKDKFLSVTNHEIRTPLTIIKGYLEILNITLENPGEEIREIIHILMRAAGELSDTVERMHLLQSLTKGKLFRKTQPLFVNSVAAECYQEMRRLFDRRHIQFKLETTPKNLCIEAHPRGFKLVLRELLQNALKFTPDGGNVWLKLSGQNDRVFIAVKDTGIGIPFDQLDLIFNNFYEVQDVINHTSSQKDFMGGGLGIGLSIVKEIVTEFKGKVTVDSESGKGSEIILSFPSCTEIPAGEPNGTAKPSKVAAI